MGKDSSQFGPGSHHRRIIWIMVLAGAIFGVLIWTYIGRGGPVADVQAPEVVVPTQQEIAVSRLQTLPYFPPTAEEKAQAINKIKQSPGLSNDQKTSLISALKAN